MAISVLQPLRMLRSASSGEVSSGVISVMCGCIFTERGQNLRQQQPGAWLAWGWSSSIRTLRAARRSPFNARACARQKVSSSRS
jgi:hypothetical protein